MAARRMGKALPVADAVQTARRLAFCLAAGVLAACATPHATGEAAKPVARTAITLSAKESEHFRAGMRGYLEATQGIVDGLASGKLAAVAESARKGGMGSVGNVSAGLALRLPPDFTLLAVDTHQKFDALAMAAERKAGRKELLDQLGAILANCGACHSMYRIASSGGR